MGFSQAEELLVESYLQGEKVKRESGYTLTCYFGHSSFKHMQLTKKTATGTGEKSMCCWEPTRKLWGTRSLSCLSDLIRTGLWIPESTSDPRLVAEIGRRAKERAENLDAKKEQTEREASEKREREEADAAAAREAEVARRAEMVKVAAFKAKVHSTPEEIAEAAALGLTAEQLDATIGLAELGPSAGIPPIVRIRRWVYFGGLQDRSPAKVVSEIINMLSATATTNESKPKAKRPKQATNSVVQNTSQRKVVSETAHRDALQAILNKAQNMTFSSVDPVVRRCTRCNERPHPQFLECICSMQWKQCSVCGEIHHATLAPCSCN